MMNKKKIIEFIDEKIKVYFLTKLKVKNKDFIFLWIKKMFKMKKIVKYLIIMLAICFIFYYFYDYMFISYAEDISNISETYQYTKEEQEHMNEISKNGANTKEDFYFIFELGWKAGVFLFDITLKWVFIGWIAGGFFSCLILLILKICGLF